MTRDELIAEFDRNRAWYAREALKPNATAAATYAACSETWRQAGERLQAMEPAPNAWTTDLPKAAGLYLWKPIAGNASEVRLDAEMFAELGFPDWYLGGQWLGPLPERAKPKGGVDA